MEDRRFTLGALGISEAARHLGIPRETFHRWARGYSSGGPLLHLAPHERPQDAPITFMAATEAWVLEGLRRAGVRPQLIRPALVRLQAEFGDEYVLLAPELATDGINVLWDFSRTSEGEGLIEGGTGQHVIREIVQNYLQYISRDADALPDRLDLANYQPAKVAMDPYHGFGQPSFVGSGVKVTNVAAMLKAGEDPEVVADEHGISHEDVGAAARVLLGRAA